MTSICPKCKVTIATFTARHRCRQNTLVKPPKKYVDMTYAEKRRFQSRQGKFF